MADLRKDMTMAPLLPLPLTLWVVVFASLICPVLLRILHPDWWKHLMLRLSIVAVVLAMVIGMVLWKTGNPSLAYGGVVLTWKLLVVFAAFTLALVPAAAVRMVLRWLSRWVRCRKAGANKDAQALTSTRRSILQGAVATVPAMALGSSVAGFRSASNPPEIVRIPMAFPSLPVDLIGLKILHLSDLHLGCGTNLSDVADLLERARPLSPDLVAITGDIAEDLDQLGPCLELLAGLGAKLGVHVCLGNHEYLRGIDDVLPILRRSRARLLVGMGTTHIVGQARLFVAGADDQPQLHNVEPVLERSIARAATFSPRGAFRLLLCHRPDGFPIATRHGFDLTLAGHTHGGQAAIRGRSARELLLGHDFLWGKYRLGESQLYTTSGVGQWFPFRLACPREAALIVLERLQTESH